MLIGGEKEMKLDDLDSEQMLKVKQTWKSFGNIWSKGEAKGVQFVAEAVQRELGVDFDVAFSILSEYEREILRRERNNVTIEAVERDTKAPSESFKESIEVQNQKATTRQELVDILLRIKYAQERHVFYDEVLNIESIPLDKVKTAHPRLHQLSIKEAENMMAGIDEQDASALLKTFNKGLVKDILDALEVNGAMSATGVLRYLGKKYANWHQRISNVLQWLVSQNLIYRVGATRFAFGGYDEVQEVEGLGALEKRVLDEFEEGSDMTSTQLYRKLSCINHPQRRIDIDKSVDVLILKGFLMRGAYRRLHRVQA